MNKAIVQVIDEELIRKAIVEEHEGEDEDVIQSMMNFATLECLKLSFKHLSNIEQLVGFGNLRKLCLDNNNIKEITGLEALTRLEWLDLSFNQITEIQGLDKLVKLTDLSLYQNKISVIQGLDNCVDLNCLSIGSNNITQIDNVMYLRRFKNLRLVNLEGNPICRDTDYKLYVLAHLKNLKYLDFKRVHQEEIAAALEAFQVERAELDERESIEDAAQERDKQRQGQLVQLKKANLDLVDTLFEDMMKADAEVTRLKVFPGLNELIEEFRESFNSQTEQFKTQALQRHTEDEKEHKQFTEALSVVLNHHKQEAIGVIAKFKTLLKKRLRVIRAMSHREMIREELEKLRQQNDQLGAELMQMEHVQSDQVEEMFVLFESRFGDMKSEALDTLQNYFRAIENLEQGYFESVEGLVEELNRKMGDNSINLSEEAKDLLSDRDEVNNSINSSHDTHVGKILAQEDDMRDRESARFDGIFKKINTSERHRNRQRVAEIQALLTRNRMEIDAAEPKIDLNEDDEH
eukprot:TRINITY_DN10232_c0_g2_i1.p1 TRINITY_DN10232_c0_g2~~TRINITY_DN10232_c0_g2_i1.p1  ORF type:complete len:519 (-),score=168.84 TRINITY_DN10232_c0_g2_i1:120-1676(-)